MRPPPPSHDGPSRASCCQSSGATDFEESTEELLSFVANYSVTVADLRAQQATCQRALNAKRIDKEALTDKYSQASRGPRRPRACGGGREGPALCPSATPGQEGRF